MKNQRTSTESCLGKRLPWLSLLGAVLAGGTPLCSQGALVNWTNTTAAVWTNTAVWSPNGTPVAANDYLVSGSSATMQAPDAATDAFPGASLTVKNGAILYLYRVNGGTAITVNHYFTNNFTLGGATLRPASSLGTVTHRIKTASTFTNANTINFGGGSYGLTLYFDSSISGSGSVAVTRGSSGTYVTRELDLTGDCSGYSGDWTITGYSSSSSGVMPLRVGHNSGWGKGSVTLNNYSSLVLNSGVTNGSVNLNSSSASLTVNNASSLGSLSGVANSQLVLNNTLAVGDDNSSTLFSGVISGASGLVKRGTGTLTLGGANTLTGTITISNGVLAIISGGAVGSSPVVTTPSGFLDVTGLGLYMMGAGQNISGNGSIVGSVYADAAAQIVPGGIGTAGTLTFSNDLTLNGTPLVLDLSSNSSSGNDQVQVIGTVILNGNSALKLNYLAGSLAAGTYTLFTYGALAGSGTFVLDSTYRDVALNVGATAVTLTVGSGASTANLTWKGDGAQNKWDILSTANWLNGGSPATFAALDNVVFDDTGSNIPAIDLAGSVSPGSVTVNAAKDYTFSTTSGGKISGGAGLTKSGAGTLTLATDNDYTGGTVVNGGTLQLGNGGTSGSVVSPIVDNSALVLNRGDVLTMSNTVSGSGRVLQTGAGTSVLAATNTYTGGTEVDNGTLQIGNGLANGAVAGDITNSGRLAFYRNDQSTLTNNLSGNGVFAFLGNGVSGQGSYILTGGNTNLTGTAVADNARVQASNQNSLGSAPALVTTNGGQFFFNGGTYTNRFELEGNGWLESAGNLGALRLEGATVSGPVYLRGNARILAYTTASGTLSGPLTGPGALEFNGDSSANYYGTLTYSGDGSGYTGSATLSQGTLNLKGSLGGSLQVSSGAFAATLNGEGSVAGMLALGSYAFGATLGIDPNTPGALTTAGGLSLNNLVTVNFTQWPSNTAPITVLNYAPYLSGTLSYFTLGYPVGSFRNSTFADTGSSITLDLGAKALTWNGATDGNWDLGISPRWNSGGSDFFYWADAVRFDDTGVNTALNLTGDLRPSSIVVDASANAYTWSGTGAIGGGASLTKSGSATLTVATTNSFSGGTILNDGRLRLGTNNALGTGALTFNGGALSSVGTNAYTLAMPLKLNGSFSLGDATDTGALTLSGAANLAANSTITVPTGNSVVQTLSGVISDGTNACSLTKEGAAGILALNAANTYEGGTIIDAGRINAANAAAFGSGTVTVNPTGQAFLTVGSANYTNAFNISGTGYSESAGQLGAIRLSGNTVSGPITLTGNARITAYTSSGTLSGPIGESGGSWKLELGGAGLGNNGGNAITISGTNTYTGGTDIRGAIVQANSSSALGTGTITLDEGASATYVTRLNLGAGVTITNDFILDSTAQTGYYGPITANGGGLAVVTGTITISANVGNGGHFASYNSGSILRVMGPINVVGGIIPNARQGTIEIGGGGNYTVFNNGQDTLRLVANDGLNPAARLSLAVSAAGTFDLNGYNQRLAELVRAGSFTATVLNNGAAASTLTLDDTTTNSYSGTLQNGTGGLSLVKQGSGTFILSGANTYTGTTAVSNGVLQVTGSLAAGSPVTVAAAGTLAGTGTVGGTVAVFGLMAPGAGVGTLTTSNETWNSGGAYAFELSSATNSGAWDKLAINGTLDLQASAGGKFTIKLRSMANSSTPGFVSDFDGTTNYTWTLATATGGILNFAPAKFAVDTTGFSNAFTGVFTVGTVGNSLVLNYGTPAVLYPPTISAWGKTAGGYQLSFSGTNGQTFDVLCSTNLALPLTNWTLLTNGTFDGSTVNFIDTTATNSQQFYRVSSPHRTP